MLELAVPFKVKGANIGDVFLVSDVVFHDRRISIPMFDLYGVGLRQAFSTPNLLEELNLKIGRLSTGDSLDMSTQDESLIIANDATLKDMEGAAVAYVAEEEEGSDVRNRVEDMAEKCHVALIMDEGSSKVALRKFIQDVIESVVV